MVSPMLAIAQERPPEGPNWAYEWKWDGFRAIVAVGSDQVRAFSRRGRDMTSTYPELRTLPEQTNTPLLLDGELVALSPEGRPSFHHMQMRMHDAHPSARQLSEAPVLLFVFDVLQVGDERLLRRPYLERREILADLELTEGPVRTPTHYTDVSGADMFATAQEHMLEGVVAKRVDSLYIAGRREITWVKSTVWQSQEVIIGGWSTGEGNRADVFGSLLVGVYDEAGRLCYAGRVGTGFDDAELRRLKGLLDEREWPTSPFDQEVPREFARRAHWVTPDLVGEAEHRRWTTDGRLWHPKWRALRPDRDPAEIVIPDDVRLGDA